MIDIPTVAFFVLQTVFCVTLSNAFIVSQTMKSIINRLFALPQLFK